MRVLSGIQPTGRPHWGNYFGAIRQYIGLQGEAQSFYFIADWHALTTIRDGARLRELRYAAALDLLALGLDPERATLFFQSDVPEVAELNWILLSVTPMWLLEKCHAYKDKKARGIAADAGLFAYPVLMAADILLYDSDVVPVGVDQVQHIEVARDIAQRINNNCGEVLVLPSARTLDDSAKVPGSMARRCRKATTTPSRSSRSRKSSERRSWASKRTRLPSKHRRTRMPVPCLRCTSCSPPPRSRRLWQHGIAPEVWATAKPSRVCSRRRRACSGRLEPAVPNGKRGLATCKRSSTPAQNARGKKDGKFLIVSERPADWGAGDAMAPHGVS